MYKNEYDLNEEQSIILRTAQQGTDPVDVERLALQYGIEIQKVDIDNDGNLCRQLDGTFVMQININHPTTRQRFTIAHEIAHYMLHRKELTTSNNCFDKNTYKGLQEYKEIEANRLAEDILMPYHLIERILDLDDVHNTQNIADKLQISEEMLRIRLQL